MRVTHRLSGLMLFALAAGPLPATAEEPLVDALRAGPEQASPPIRFEVVAQNLWDVLWRNPPARPVTGDTRFDWKWFATRYDTNGDGVVTREEFTGPEDTFTRLDRNWDGRLTREDFDWAGGSTLGRQKATTFALMKWIDKSSDGRITADEWQAAFDRLAKDKGYLDDTDLERLVFQPAVRKAQADQKVVGGRPKSRPAHLEQLAESGKLFTDGPRVGEVAPDFTLRSPDGKTKVRLSSFRGDKPVVLVFGSFT